MSQYTYTIGKKKTASAQVRLYEWKWENVVNGKNIWEYITRKDLFEIALSPLKMCKVDKEVYFTVDVEWSWESSQAAAIAHGLSRALSEKDNWHKAILKSAGMLTRDARKVERKKPGLKKARKSPSWSKR